MKDENKNSRRNFLDKGLKVGLATVAGGVIAATVLGVSNEEEMVELMSTDGTLIQVPASEVEEVPENTNYKAREGYANRKFVMVVDLANCRNALKCQDSCNKNHYITGENAWLKVYKMQEEVDTAPYWMPMMCQHCDNPPCVKVCPVGATYKRSDGLVLIDNKRCIGCRFCMAACPYSARVFNWGEPKNQDAEVSYSPETSIPSQVGTVEKCDFCPDMLRKNKVPHCITACPNGALYFGDQNADSVTNGSETVRLSTLLQDKAGYRYHEELGTKPNVYYLPPADRLFPFKDAPEGQPS
jgi:Fe-S-cluster-containing dehydrogenase component